MKIHSPCGWRTIEGERLMTGETIHEADVEETERAQEGEERSELLP